MTSSLCVAVNPIWTLGESTVEIKDPVEFMASLLSGGVLSLLLLLLLAKFGPLSSACGGRCGTNLFLNYLSLHTHTRCHLICIPRRSFYSSCSEGR